MRHEHIIDLQAMAQRSVLCWLATVNSHGEPNVSPKEVFVVDDDAHVVIANIASPGSARNIRVNPQVCLCFVDVFAQKGVKVTGTATEFQSHETGYRRWQRLLEPLTGERFRVNSVFVVKIKKLEALLAPSYQIYPQETTEESQVQSALRTYGVERRELPTSGWLKSSVI